MQRERIRNLGVGILVAACGWSASVMAQDHDAPPLYETLQLAADFLPDPRVVELLAGGDFDAAGLGAGCVGYINPDSPDVTIEFADPQRPLNLYVRSDSDTTLVVRLPNGNWLCDDDSEGVNPWVRLPKPVPGRYAVWVGTFSAQDFPSANLYVSELDPDWGGGEAVADFDPEAAPRFGSHALTPGFAPDPLEIALSAGGSDAASDFAPACSGRVDASAPDVVFSVAAGLPALTVYATSDADTTLAVLTPAGDWLCDDDSHGLNPAVTVAAPEPGEYRVWVGLWGGEDAEAMLFATAGAPAWDDGVPRMADLPPIDIAGLSPLAAFERIVAEVAPPGGLVWSSAEPLGDTGFTLHGVELQADFDEPPIRMERVVVDRLDLEAMASQSPPAFLDIAIAGLVVPIDPADAPEQLAELGIDTLTLDAALAFEHDAATRRLTLDHLNLDLRELAALELGLVIDGFDAEELMSGLFDPLAPGTGLVEAHLSFQDAGLLQRLMAQAAADQGITVEALIEQSIGELDQQLPPGLADDPAVQAARQALESFLRDIPEQSGTLLIRLRPPQPLGLSGFLGLEEAPDELFRALGLSIEYTPR